MSSPVFAICCGKTADMASRVIASIKPEIEVVHMILSPAQGASEIPKLLRGEAVSDPQNLGSKDYSRPVQMVLAGGGYDDASFEELFSAAKGIRPIPWLKRDHSVDMPQDPPSYAKGIVARIKAKVKELQETGRMEVEEVHRY